MYLPGKHGPHRKFALADSQWSKVPGFPPSNFMCNGGLLDVYVYQRRRGINLVPTDTKNDSSRGVHEASKEERRLGPISAWYEGKSKVEKLEDKLSIQNSKLAELEILLSDKISEVTD